ncbi:LolA family protein [Oceanibacterium hippocampi]|uniref:Outer-membrane lipoprotein carrier protein n=1 Tax=Oceanibacterium hippocampi TaxID=745714 RepID=A0A1Y5RH52_9PROT|nr:outer membrane lipoprotein carrier protein LolA [Oceanibacterium hippocampi]SLN16199.1 Outer-membrane lipoprotein carrier protein precursor [Oceanibacterium hippocampi]
MIAFPLRGSIRHRLLSGLRGLAAAFLLALLPLGASATPLPPAEAGAVVARIEAYLNGIRSMKASFIQVSPDGSVVNGEFYLRRPGKARFEYQPDVPILVVADGLWLIFYDKEVEQVTRLPLFSTPISVLLRDEVSLGDSIRIEAVERVGGLVSVRVRDSGSPEEGALTLIFSEEPMALRKWIALDPQGYETQVTLVNPVYNLDLPAKLFVFQDPAPSGPGR